MAYFPVPPLGLAAVCDRGFIVKLRMFILALVVALAVAGAGWKWTQPGKGHAYGPEKVAGWTWDGSAMLAD
jgi:hypothetical protein